MSATKVSLAAEKREKTGTGAARAVRRAGKIPAIIYAKGSEPTNIALDANELTHQFKKGRFRSRLLGLMLDGKDVRVLPQAVQTHPVTDQIEHVDFLRVEKGVDIRVKVPVKIINTEKCKGLKRGGALNVVRHTIEFFCDPDQIPEEIVVDVLETDIGTSVHIEDLNLPKGVTPVIKRNFTVITITGRGKAEEIDDTSAPVATTEVPAMKAKAADEDKK